MVSSWRAGQTVAGGKYRLVRQIGRGSFGDVFLVEELAPGGAVRQQAVLKVLHLQWAQVPQVVERFRRESQISQRVEHPHVARIFEHGQLEGGVPFIAMEYLHGRPLRTDILAGQGERGLPQASALALLGDVSDALACAHRAGVVHRDLKPENILLVQRGGRPDYPVVLDFGVAKFLDAAERLTMTGAVLGTPSYMAPEQFRGEGNLGPPADVYALGVLAFEVCTGRPPFAGRNFAELAIAHTSQPAPPLPGVPKDVTKVIARCLDKDPAKRPRADAVAQVLRTAAGRAPQPAPSSSHELPPTVFSVDSAAMATVLSPGTQRDLASARRRGLARALIAAATTVLVGALLLLGYFVLSGR